MSHPTFTPQPQRITTLWPVLISRPTEGKRLSWPGWLVTYLDGMPAQRRSPIPAPAVRQCGGQSSARPLSRKSDALTTRLPSHWVVNNTSKVRYELPVCWRNSTLVKVKVKCRFYSKTVRAHFRERIVPFHVPFWFCCVFYKNSSGDEIANVNFLRRYRTKYQKKNLLRLTN